MTSFKFDFAKGDFDVVDGKVTKISGQELIKNKIEKLLLTGYNKYGIYTNYGMPYHNWIYGQRDRELIKLALARELSERIPAQIDGVRQVYDINIDFDRRGAKISFAVDTIYTERDEVSTWIAF